MSAAAIRRRGRELTVWQRFNIRRLKIMWFFEDWWHGYGRFKKAVSYAPPVTEAERRAAAHDYYHALGDALGSGQKSIELR